jgi:hypothetical protein
VCDSKRHVVACNKYDKVVICVHADIRWQGWKAKVPAPLGHIPIALLKGHTRPHTALLLAMRWITGNREQ